MDFPGSSAESTTAITSFTQSIASSASFQTAIFDVRDTVSFYLGVQSTVPGASTDWAPLEVTLTWYDTASGANIIFVDEHCFFADSAAGVALLSYGKFELCDAQHGPFLRVKCANVGPDSQNVSLQLIGTSRTLTQPYANQGNTVGDLFLISPTKGQFSLAAGASLEIPARYGYGRVRWRVSTTNGFTLNWFCAGEPLAFDSVNTGVGLTYVSELLCPKRSLNAQIVNGGSPNTGFVNAILEMSRV